MGVRVQLGVMVRVGPTGVKVRVRVGVGRGPQPANCPPGMLFQTVLGSLRLSVPWGLQQLMGPKSLTSPPLEVTRR